MRNFEKLFISDIDNTLLGDNNALQELKDVLSKVDFSLGVGVASGRTVHAALEVLSENGFPEPDIVISSVGSEIYFKQEGKLLYNISTDWKRHLSEGWDRDEIVESLNGLKDIEMQNSSEQGEHKVSYHINEDTNIDRIKERLGNLNQKIKLIISTGKDMDVLPERSGKGKAIKFVSEQLKVPLASVIVSGDSGNDEDMLTIGSPAIVVGNYSSELEKLKGKKTIYFAEREYAGGILEGMKNFNFISNGF